MTDTSATTRRLRVPRRGLTIVVVVLLSAIGFAVFRVASVPRLHNVPTTRSNLTLRPADLPRVPSVGCRKDAATTAAAEAVRRALEFRQVMLVPAADSADHAFSAADIDALRVSGTQSIAELFTGVEAAREQGALTVGLTTLSGDADNRALAGGVTQFACTHTKTDGDTTTISGTAAVWASGRHVDANGIETYFQPVNVVLVSATVTTDATGHRAVSSLSSRFAPGGGP